MKKFLNLFILFFLIILISLIIILSTTGIKKKKFNNLISEKINRSNYNIKLNINTINFKLDIKEISLFLGTNNPNIEYRNVKVPAKSIKVYIDFLSIFKSTPQIEKINLVLGEFDVEQLKKLSVTLKPSNFRSFIKNKILAGKLNTVLEIYLNEENLIDNFIAKGSVSNLKAKISNDFNLDNSNFSYFADKTDVLIKNFFGDAGPLKIEDGDIVAKISPEISLECNFKSIIKKSNQENEKFSYLQKKNKYLKMISNLDAEINNSFSIIFDKTYKVKNYDYKGNGKISSAFLNFDNLLENSLLIDKVNHLSIMNSIFETNFSSKDNKTTISGKYVSNQGISLPFELENKFLNNTLKLKLNFDYEKTIQLDLINYKKSKGSIANISVNLDKKLDNLRFNEISFIEGKNQIFLSDVKFSNNNLNSFKKISIKTFKDNIENNNFSIIQKDKILIKGTQFDASNLPKILNSQTKNNFFSEINKEIEIDLTNIVAPLSEKLKNFKLIGKIENGKFTKISSKGDFGGNNFLDISMKKDKNSKKKYLEIYSDITKPLLTEYSFFKGLTGGKLLFTSIIDNQVTSSKLKIENFKVINAPGMVKLLSLADLGGLADLAEGEGLTFDVLEIKMEKKKDTLQLNEILALGPSISVLMEGYQDLKVTSLRGTLVPAKTLNKMISKIPVIGDIVIPKEVGEGLFGISFKMKGPPGKIKTTINPIRTITPRFIQKIVDKKRN